MRVRILIVDDHQAVRRMLKSLVETHAGWEVCGEAENGREAVVKSTELKPDLIVMDMAMPVMDGIRASREISKASPNIPIVMHTLHYSPELELEAKKAGARQVVSKSESGDVLVKVIEEVLSSQLKSAVAGTALPAEMIATTAKEAAITGPAEPTEAAPEASADPKKRAKTAE